MKKRHRKRALLKRMLAELRRPCFVAYAFADYGLEVMSALKDATIYGTGMCSLAGGELGSIEHFRFISAPKIFEQPPKK